MKVFLGSSGATTGESVGTFGASFASRGSWAFLLSFVFGFVVRLIPEVLSLPYPIGYDPIYYAWRIDSGVVWYHWSQVFSTWLLYGILIPVHNVTRLDPFLLLKLTVALLFGFNACGIYYFAKKALGWTTKNGLLASVFFSLQAAALAFSTNFYKNMLGLGILLFALPLVKNGFKNMRRFLVFVLLSVLVVFGHEYGSVILFAVVLGLLVNRFFMRANADIAKVLIAVGPALALFLASVYLIVFPVRFEVGRNIFAVHEPRGNYHGAIFFFKNYLALYEPAQHYTMYLNVTSEVFSLFAGFYLVSLPLVLAGFFRDNILDSWTVLLLVGSFGVLIMPFFALQYWYRWMLMLVYPFTFYAVNGALRVLRSSRKAVGSIGRRVKWLKRPDLVVKLVLVLPFCCGLAIVPSMVNRTYDSAVPLGDVDDTVRVMQWLDSQMDDDSAFLVHYDFYNWALVYLDDKHTIVSFKSDIEGAAEVALEHGFDDVYFAWWNQNVAQYHLGVPKDFMSVFSSGRISVFWLTLK